MKCPKCDYIIEENKEEREFIKKIISLGAQGRYKEAEKLCKDKFGYFEL